MSSYFMDGVTAINIGQGATTALGKKLSWIDAHQKRTVDGDIFHMYAGLHYHLITSGNNRRFLSATSPSELEGAKKYQWQNVPGLETHLESALLFNLRMNPITLEMIKHNELPIVWDEPYRGLKNAELRWLRVVNRVVVRLHNELKSEA